VSAKADDKKQQQYKKPIIARNFTVAILYLEYIASKKEETLHCCTT
jgi:hypothetical protein